MAEGMASGSTDVPMRTADDAAQQQLVVDERKRTRTALDALDDEALDDLDARDRRRMSAAERAMDSIIQLSASKQLPASLQKQIRATMLAFERCVQQVFKAKDCEEKYLRDIEELNQGNMPAGCKPFRVIESTELDMAISETDMLDLVLTVPTDPDISFRELKRRIHLMGIMANRQLDRMMTTIKIGGLQEATKHTVFMQQVQAHEYDHMKDIRDLGIDIPPGLFAPVKGLTELEAMTIYRKMIEKLASERKLDKTTKEQDEKNKKKAIDEAAKLNPRDVLKLAMRQAIAEERVQHAQAPGYTIDYLGLQVHATAEEAVKKTEKKEKERRRTKSELAKHKEAKNGGAPGKAGGKGKAEKEKDTTVNTQNEKGTSKGKSKSPEKGKSKGKGKGSRQKGGNEPWHGKGKGKGNGKQERQKGKGK